jgi:hypothetical protein
MNNGLLPVVFQRHSNFDADMLRLAYHPFKALHPHCVLTTRYFCMQFSLGMRMNVLNSTFQFGGKQMKFVLNYVSCVM